MALVVWAARVATRGAGAAFLPLRAPLPRAGIARAAQGPMAVALAADCALSLTGGAGAPVATLILLAWCVSVLGALPLTRLALVPRTLTAPPPLPEVRG